MSTITQLMVCSHVAYMRFNYLSLKSNVAEGGIRGVSLPIGQWLLGLLCLISLNYWATSPTKHQSYKCLQSRFHVIHSLLILALSSVTCDKIYRTMWDRCDWRYSQAKDISCEWQQHSCVSQPAFAQLQDDCETGWSCLWMGDSAEQMVPRKGSQETVHEHCVFVGAWAVARNVYKESALSFLVQD